jgi:hypothetical protein
MMDHPGLCTRPAREAEEAAAFLAAEVAAPGTCGWAGCLEMLWLSSVMLWKQLIPYYDSVMLYF